jgi:hypothetical protein
MEQDSALYEFRMNGERYIFEAHGPRDAAKYETYALLHFRERLGERFSERALEGPFERADERPRKSS